MSLSAAASHPHPPPAASQEFYKLPAFPRCLHGVKFALAAGFVYDTYGAVLVATDDGRERGGVHLHVSPLALVRARALACGPCAPAVLAQIHLNTCV